MSERRNHDQISCIALANIRVEISAEKSRSALSQIGLGS
ncbi:hypothetical protein SynPROSU1_00692 [Synechococcus sp. PROS-U-1]|nr:hypothetical protein SynPROSU1_00692 [Synechococcus sp. PROS-U-1]